MTTSPGRTRPGPSSLLGLDDARRGTRHVVVVGVEQSGVLGGLAADQRTPGDHAGLGDALHDGSDPLGDHAAAGDVVGHEQRLGAADDEVVDDHARRGRSRSCRGCPSAARSRPWCRRRRWRWRAAAGCTSSARSRRRARRSRPGPRSSPDGGPSRRRPSSGRSRGRPRRSRRRQRRRPRVGVGTVGLLGHVSPRVTTGAGQGLLRTGSARPIVGDCSVASSRCLPRRLSSGSSMGYSPVKQAVHRRSAVWPVASTMPSSEM